ncbi:E3 ubiquitin-protein ligase RNF180-like [Pecten maximus]|uniref:E3 ubiquitin-protein ligase RNF180-like n=1 Tax=Pecten maximus TaxID=6579 RepID=UPI0014584E47|nr:E3 ubiquitin-protein ligase RNF180-like [Pecten maximus]XP_033725954.1 E3 ubiquitin-protein ligase RNF180-like [Pecten maximus]
MEHSERQSDRLRQGDVGGDNHVRHSGSLGASKQRHERRRRKRDKAASPSDHVDTAITRYRRPSRRSRSFPGCNRIRPRDPSFEETDRQGLNCSPGDSTANQENEVNEPIYPEEHICPICLDLYCHPMETRPCKHVFCDTCLRRLARRTNDKTPCPLCRRVILGCHAKDDFAQFLEAQYSVFYKKRQAMVEQFHKDSYHNLPVKQRTKLKLPSKQQVKAYFVFFALFLLTILAATLGLILYLISLPVSAIVKAVKFTRRICVKIFDRLRNFIN